MSARQNLGPLLVLLGALGLFVVSFFTWYEVDLGAITGGATFARRYADLNQLATGADAWAPWGLFWDLALLTTVVGSAALAILGLAGAGRAVGAALGAMGLGALGTMTVLLHILNRPQPHAIVSVTGSAWLGLVCAAVIFGGGFLWWDSAHRNPVQE